MNHETKAKILQKIKDYDRIMLFRHIRNDGDCVGATKGFKRILQLSFPEKEIYQDNTDFSDYVGFLGDEKAPASDGLFADALGIVVDTATTERISSKRFSLCRELVKIDHHINMSSYAATEWVEEERSSLCEMIVAFYDQHRDELKIDAEAATYLYTGMVTDSGRFRFRDVSGETLRLAGILLDLGIDTEHLYANLYMKDFSALKYQSYIYRKMKLTPNGVAYVYVTPKVAKRFGLSIEALSAGVSHMESIKGSLIWIAFIQSKDEIRVRLRSRFVTVSEIAEKYRGGGHACAAGATVMDKAEMKRLLADADQRLAEYKASNEGWL